MAKQPNLVFILTDQERYQPKYENEAVKSFMSNLKGHKQLRKTGVEFHHHYTASCACTPSRACLYTGQYPSLHHVTQTYGGAKSADDPRLVWLQPNTIPTMGNYFQAAGYETKYIGKWHLSHEDITDDNGFVPPTSSSNKERDLRTRERYLEGNPLEKFGFSGWIGPEPHGPGLTNSGWKRDQDYVQQFLDYLASKEKEENPKPFLVVINLVNPHDIVLFPYWLSYGLPTTDGTVPEIPAAPTHRENLQTKPSTQLSYRQQYSKMFFPDFFQEKYRQLYYYLHKVVDEEIFKIYSKLASTKFFSNTFTVLTSDHGDLLGAHGGLRQKWYNAYEETLHVPLIISHPNMAGNRSLNLPTSSVDIIPTLLGLANINPAELYPLLEQTHSEVHPLVGTDLSRFALAGSPRLSPSAAVEKEILEATFRPVYSQIADHVTQGQNQVFSGAKGKVSLLQVHHFEFDSVEGPTSIEMVVQFLASPVKKDLNQQPAKKLWKLVRYFDDPALWSHPGQRHEEVKREGLHLRGTKVIRHEPLQDQYELYNLTDDPLEVKNLAHPAHHPLEAEAEFVWGELRTSLVAERSKKALKTRNPLPKQPHKKLPVFVTKSQANDTLSEAVMKIFGSFPNPDPRKPLPYPKL